MQIKDIMTADVATCRPDDNLAEIARITHQPDRRGEVHRVSEPA